MKRKKRTNVFFILLLLAFFSLTNCGVIDAIRNALGIVDDHAGNIEDILNNATGDILASASNWESILRDTIDKIPDAERQVKADLQSLLTSSVGVVGSEFRCNIDFFGRRLAEKIESIKAKFLNLPLPAKIPVTCTLDPSAIDMNLPINNRNKITIFGYNFLEGNLKLYHQTTTSLLDVSGALTKNSDYEVTINLGLNGIRLNTGSMAIVIKSGERTIMSVPVIQSYPEICDTSEVFTKTGMMEVIPRKTAGDAEWGGNGPCVYGTVRLTLSSDRKTISASLSANMYECSSNLNQRNDSKAYGFISDIIYTAPHNMIIEKISSPMVATLEKIYTGHDNHNQTTLPRSGLVKNWTIRGDTSGNDIGESFVRVSLNAIQVVLRETEACVTEEELQALLDADRLSNKTLTRFLELKPIYANKLSIKKDVLKLMPKIINKNK